MRKISLLVSMIPILLLFFGCSGNIPISGKVTFDDGEPVTFGQVVFDSPKESFSGRLDENGHYLMGVNDDRRGIPPGTYKVWLSGTVLLEDIPVKNNDEAFEVKETLRVAPKYTLPKTSDLTFNAARNGEKHFDFTVERPDPKLLKKKQ